MNGRGDDRPAVPPSVKLALRQQAAFGCCKCGYPFYQYHHIIPWADEQHFRPADMMLLCPQCHDFVTRGKVSQAEQRKWKEKPHNIAQGLPKGLLWIDQKSLTVKIGDCLFADCPTCLEIEHERVIESRPSKDGRLLLSLRLRDANDNLLAEIVDNEWRLGDAAPWDFEARYREIKLRLKSRSIGLEVDARETPIAIRGTFRNGGKTVEAMDALKVGRSVVSECMIAGFAVAISVTRNGVALGVNR